MPVRVSDLHYVALAVPDLAAERAFFGETWGLIDLGEHDGGVYFAAEASEHPFVIRLREDAERKTDLLGFSAESKADVEALFAQAMAAGAKPISSPAPAAGPAGGFACRFFDLDGRAIEVICDSNKRAARSLKPGEAIPTGLSHVVLHSPDLKKLVRFYEEALGFRVSDWIGEFMVFLRCNTAHHRLAFLPGAPALNHVAFDLASIDELMRGLARLTEKGVAIKWGPGRHTAGNNTFTYYLTPNGNSVEYTSDLEEVDDATWQSQVYPPSPAITDQWGTGRIIPGNVPFAESKPDPGLWHVPA
jgi:catechol 2,3-dioxygenase-like lactoylglutathione lyase family enzyme